MSRWMLASTLVAISRGLSLSRLARLGAVFDRRSACWNQIRAEAPVGFNDETSRTHDERWRFQPPYRCGPHERKCAAVCLFDDRPVGAGDHSCDERSPGLTGLGPMGVAAN